MAVQAFHIQVTVNVTIATKSSPKMLPADINLYSAKSHDFSFKHLNVVLAKPPNIL